MKTIIIDLPPNLSPNGIGLALRAIADDILTGAVVPVPPFCYCIDTAVGLVTFWDSESDTLRDPPAADNQAHPPLGTTLANFTAAMLDALPVGSAFGTATGTGYEVRKAPDGWRFSPGGELATDFGPEYNQTRPLIRVGPEQTSEPERDATLPDPWPGMVVEVQADSADEWDRGAIRRAYRARHGAMYVHVEGLENPVQWHPDEIREVRTPDGTTLWKRPAAKVTTEPRPLSTYTEEERRAFPVGTKIGIYTKHADAFPPVGEVWRAADGLTLMGGYVADAMARSGDMLVHFPAKVTT